MCGAEKPMVASAELQGSTAVMLAERSICDGPIFPVMILSSPIIGTSEPRLLLSLSLFLAQAQFWRLPEEGSPL